MSIARKLRLPSPRTLKILYDCARSGNYAALKKAWVLTRRRHEWQDRPSRLDIMMLCMDADARLQDGAFGDVQAIADTLVARYDAPEGFYYLAMIDYLHGRLSDAKARLDLLFARNPAHADGVYLLADICRLTGEDDVAKRALTALAPLSSRRKTWRCLANLVRTPDDFNHLQRQWTTWKYHNPADPEVLRHMVTAALMAGDHAAAKKLCRDLIDAALRAKRKKKAGAKNNNYSGARAERALLDVAAAFDRAGIDMFLISGTLLGVVRENRLLSHDKDIDIGIWEDVPPKQVIAAVQASGLFMVPFSRSPELLRLRHVNGTVIDVFYHYRGEQSVWHKVVKQKWHNSPFGLAEKRFLGRSFKVPSDAERYLAENYGDWKTPKTEFDCAFDTPNSETLSADEMAAHCCLSMADAVLAGKKTRAIYYLQQIEKLGGIDFVEFFMKKCEARL